VLSVDLETGVVVEADGFSYSVNENGEQYLVSVAATLWDVYDSVNDNPDGDGCSDQMADGVQSSWNLIADHPGVPMQTLCDFWYEFWRRYHQPGLAGPLNSTFCEHGVVCSGLVAVELIGPEPGKLLLEGCHPNPFRGSTRLFFSVPRLPGRVRLHVFDAAGHVVKSLVDGEMSPGRYAVSWDGRDDQDNPIAPNVYFVRLASMAGTRTSKVVFLR